MAHEGRERHGEQARALAQVMADAAWAMQAPVDREATLSAMLSAAVETVPGAEVAGITLAQNGQLAPQVRTHKLAVRLDELQGELGEGPCLTSLREQHVVQIDDLATDERWSRFGPRAAEMGARSVLSFRLFVSGASLGALNLYSTEAGAFDAESYLVGNLFAQHASVAYAEASAQYHQGRALATRDLIGQAKGILMQRDRLTGERAFAALVEASQAANMKLVDVAQWLVDGVESRTIPAGQ